MAGVFADNSILTGGEGDEVKMIVGETYTLPADIPTHVAIAEPNKVDVVSIAEKRIILIGKGKGRTNFSYTDATGDHSIKINVIPEDIAYVAMRIKDILKDINLPDIYLRPIEDQGKVMLLGTVRNTQEKERMKAGLGELSSKIVDMVQIEEAALVEVSIEVFELDKGATKEMGFTVPRSITVADTAPAASTHWADFFKIGPLQRIDPSAGAGAAGSLSWQLDLLANEGKAQILARPRVVCQSGKEADFLVGGEVPVFNTSVTSLGGQGTSVEYKQFGIKLNISPTVVSDKRIQLGLKFDISELGESDTIGSASSPTAKAYPLKTRSVSTQLHLEDGDTLAIGGLIKKKSSEDLAKFPWLADIPILGAFFRHKTTTTGTGSAAKDDTELFITLTPRIIYTAKAEKHEDKEAKEKQKEFIDTYARTDMPKELQDYILAIQKKIMDSVAYPASLVGTGWQGEVVLKLIVEKAGSLKEAQVLKSSGYKIFDEEALKLVQNINYPPFNFESSLEEIKIEVPINYRERK
jgi:pilus assembly protein CpaC